jgi:hypothetical protein
MQMLLNGAIPGSQEPARVGEDRHPTSIIGRLYRLGEPVAWRKMTRLSKIAASSAMGLALLERRVKAEGF